MRTKYTLLGSLFVFCLVAAAAPAPKRAGAFDWPQWRGAKHDNISTETGLLKSWPKEGPKLAWTSQVVGLGYSGPAIVGDRLYTLGSNESNDFVVAVDAKNGEKIWATNIGSFVNNGWGGGPRSTPTVDGEYLYALSSAGDLACLKTSDGEKVWSVSLTGKLGGGKPNWNYSESPLVDGEQVVCSPGGKKGTLAALDKKTGEVLWQSKDLTDPAGYSSIVPTTVGGVRQYVQLTMKGIAGISPKDGSRLWYYTHRKVSRPPAAVIPTPVIHDEFVYASVGYGVGDVLLKLSSDGDGTKAEQIYSQEAMNVMDNKHEGYVLIGDYVYGWSDKGGWTCQELKSGKMMWQSKKLGRGSITAADGMLYCYSEDRGTAVLIEASPEGWKEHGRFNIPKQSTQRSSRGGVWTHPVVANGKLYLRDQELLFCFEVK